MKTTPKELAVIEHIINLQNLNKTKFTLSDLIEQVYSENSFLCPRPENVGRAMASTLRNLGDKVERYGCVLKRTSKLGRGAKGVYVFSGDFHSLVEPK